MAELFETGGWKRGDVRKEDHRKSNTSVLAGTFITHFRFFPPVHTSALVLSNQIQISYTLGFLDPLFAGYPLGVVG